MRHELSNLLQAEHLAFITDLQYGDMTHFEIAQASRQGASYDSGLEMLALHESLMQFVLLLLLQCDPPCCTHARL